MYLRHHSISPLKLWPLTLGSISLTIFHSQFIFDEYNSYLSLFSWSGPLDHHKFCTCHDSCAVVTCAKLWWTIHQYQEMKSLWNLSCLWKILSEMDLCIWCICRVSWKVSRGKHNAKYAVARSPRRALYVVTSVRCTCKRRGTLARSVIVVTRKHRSWMLTCCRSTGARCMLAHSAANNMHWSQPWRRICIDNTITRMDPSRWWPIRNIDLIWNEIMGEVELYK